MTFLSRVFTSAVSLPFLALIFSVLAVCSWTFRILRASNPMVGITTWDLYTSYVPMFSYASSSIRSGDFPLWNPYQLCGEPFFAIPYIGLLYPLNAVYLLFETPFAIEVSIVLHMVLGAVGMAALLRLCGVGLLGTLCGALTFAWSPYLISRSVQPVLFAAISWMPITIFLIERVMRGIKLAWLWLILGVACLIFIGASEILLHILYVAALWVLVSLAGRIWRDDWRLGIRRALLVGACMLGAACLATVQLLPAIELVGASPRAPGSLTFYQVIAGSVPPEHFIVYALSTGKNVVTVGVWPLLAMVLAPGFGSRRLWTTGLLATCGAALLMFGGWFYALYFSIPVVGGLFRMPAKFLDIYCFGQAVLAGVAMARLQSWASLGRKQLWRHPGWWGALLLAAVALGWLGSIGKFNPYLAVILALLLAFGITSSRRFRISILAGICVVHAVNLFLVVDLEHKRPVVQPEIIAKQEEYLDLVPKDRRHARVYVSRKLSWGPILIPKQGQLSRIEVTSDYEPLAPGRYEAFFDYLSKVPQAAPFFGQYTLGPDARWRLMDLTATRYYLMQVNEPGEIFMREHPRAFRPIFSKWPISLYERKAALPRAYFASKARWEEDPDEVLRHLSAKRFNPRAEVVLERIAKAEVAGAGPGSGSQSWAGAGEAPTARETTIVETVSTAVRTAARRSETQVEIRSHLPERIAISADVPNEGFLVLTDLFYPGWEAQVNGEAVEIFRANFLFRAVKLPPGHSEIVFEYRPASFRNGLRVTGATAAIIIFAFLAVRARSSEARA